MSNLGNLKKQFTHILAQAILEGYKIEDVIPEAMQDDFQEMKELQTARTYIKEIEGREKDLQTENHNLLDLLKEKEVEIENQPEEFKALKVDLQLASRQIQYYKEIAERATERLDRQKRKHTQDIRIHTQHAATEASHKISDLQTQLTTQQKAYLELFEQNRTAAETHTQQRAHDDKHMEEVLARLAALEIESETMYDSYNALIDTLEAENASTSASVNAKAMLLASRENLYNVLVSEITPLNRFFARTYEALRIYQTLFQAPSDPHSADIHGLLLQLDELMEGAKRDLEVYHGVNGALVEVHGLAEEQVMVQMCGLGVSARATYEGLLCVRDDVRRVWGMLESEPNTWLVKKWSFGGD
jgi:myosin heavy subunit